MRMHKKFALGAVVLAGLSAGAAQAANAPPAPTAEFVLEEIVKLGPVVEVGKTSKGERRIIPITGGRFEGPGIKGEIVPGGWDWQLTRADGCTEVEADYFLKTDDGVVINVINKGALCPPAQGAAPSPVRTHPVFEAPLGKYEWMSKTAFIGTLEMADPAEGPAVKIRFYKMK
ncbi:MAG: hypothetical protein BGO57_07830 [Sphingomonadales bacterium 63-6]|nr:MAG: hypothetical protein BGO57_07830 [Sphingomonadales bacterium 63-6]